MLTLLVVGLATWQAVEVFRHSTLTPVVLLRAWMENQGGFLYDIRSCGWCMSLWVALALYLMFQVPLLSIIVWALAISRAANIANDLSYEWTRTPKDD